MISKSVECHEHCPKCGSEEIAYVDGRAEDDKYYYSCVCDNCSFEFTEVYDIIYKETTYEDI